MEGGVVGQSYETLYFHPQHPHPPSRNDSPKNSVDPAYPPAHRCRTLLLLLAQMKFGLLRGLWVWLRRTNRRPCCPPMSNPPISSWTARPDGSGRWDNRMAAQHLPRDLVRPSSGLKNWLKRRKSREQRCPVYIVFIGLTKVYRVTNREGLYTVLTTKNIFVSVVITNEKWLYCIRSAPSTYRKRDSAPKSGQLLLPGFCVIRCLLSECWPTNMRQERTSNSFNMRYAMPTQYLWRHLENQEWSNIAMHRLSFTQLSQNEVLALAWPHQRSVWM